MAIMSYSRGLILWVDDNFENQKFPNNLWAEIFGDYSDRVLRLLDLYIEVATSYEEAIDRISKFDSYKEAGVFIFCVVDLVLPPRSGANPEMKYGVALAKEIKKRDLNFVFLSSNTGSSSILDEERLENIPYHVKEPGSDWRFPESLVLNVLSELRRHVSWVSLDDTPSILNEASDICLTYRLMPKTFKFFPFFGNFREFVERCEYRQKIDFPTAFAVRSPQKHCDEFIQQALVIMLYPLLIRKPGQVIIRYGLAHNPAFIDSINSKEIKDNPENIVVIRVSPDFTSVTQLKSIVNLTGNILGKIILILPNDESVDEYIEYLRGIRILVKEELPSMKSGDLEEREKLLRHACELAIHQWAANNIPGEPKRLDRGSITYPELLINPTNWITLFETKNIPEALSDPFEIVKEFTQVFENMGDEQKEAIQRALEFGSPIPYKLLLRVGQEALLTSEFKDELGIWVERSLENWLKTSWQYPYGISEIADTSQQTGIKNSTQSVEKWQNSCYEILVGILNEYSDYTQKGSFLTPSIRLKTVVKFIDALGGIKFLDSENGTINWDDLALMRWPHRHYPMPSIILRRLREAGRYLWIQPEILDIATTLPTGRQRYRMLNSTVEYYWSVLSWLRSIQDDLPLGWKWSISYLIRLIDENKIASAWNKNPAQVWFALLGLLRNGGPIIYLADQIIRKKPLTTGSGNVRGNLNNVKGYGNILERLRGSRKFRLGGYLSLNFDGAINYPDAEQIVIIRKYLEIISENTEKDNINRLSEIEIAAQQLIQAISTVGTVSAKNNSEISTALNDSISEFFTNPDLKMLEGNGWYLQDLMVQAKKNGGYGEIPSLISTKADFLWKLCDTFVYLDNITRSYRYCDGYHFLAALNDLRIKNKDTCPNVSLSMIESVIDLFLVSIEGILAQLSFCALIAGENELAEKIKPQNIAMQVSTDFSPPPSDQLSEVMRINLVKGDWEIYTLGIPGEETVKKLCYHNKDGVRVWDQTFLSL